MKIIPLTHDQFKAALDHIEEAMADARYGNDREGTARRALTKVLIDLDLGIKVVPE